MASVKAEAGELDREEKEVVTPSDNNVSLQEFTAGASGYVEYTGVIKGESESNIMKRLKIFLKRQKKSDAIPSLRSADAFLLKQKTEEFNKGLSSISLNDIRDFKNLLKAGATTVCERMGIRKSVKSKQEPLSKIRIESDIARLSKESSRLDGWRKGKWKKD